MMLDYYASCMDMPSRNQARSQWIIRKLAQIATYTDADRLSSPFYLIVPDVSVYDNKEPVLLLQVVEPVFANPAHYNLQQPTVQVREMRRHVRRLLELVQTDDTQQVVYGASPTRLNDMLESYFDVDYNVFMARQRFFLRQQQLNLPPLPKGDRLGVKTYLSYADFEKLYKPLVNVTRRLEKVLSPEQFLQLRQRVGMGLERLIMEVSWDFKTPFLYLLTPATI